MFSLLAWGCWDDATVSDLQLPVDELQHYMDKSLGTDKRLLESHDICPVVLHAYGCQFDPCPCGCRSAAFNEATLRQKGLRAFFVVDNDSNVTRLLHPVELGALMSLPPQFKIFAPVRGGSMPFEKCCCSAASSLDICHTCGRGRTTH